MAREPLSFVRTFHYSTSTVKESFGVGVAFAPLNVMTTPTSFSAGVPGFGGGGGGPIVVPPPPPPQEAIANSDAKAIIARAMLQRRNLFRKLASKSPMQKMHAIATPGVATLQSKPDGRLPGCAVAAPGAVVWNVTVAVAVVALLLRITDGTLKLQVVSDGIPEHNDDESGIVPV